MAPLFTQNEIVYDLQQEGFNVTVRDLRYWRELNQLPELHYNENYYYYPEEIVTQIKALCYERDKAENLMTFRIEGEEFEIQKLIIIKHNGKYIHKYYSGDIILIQEKESIDVRAD